MRKGTWNTLDIKHLEDTCIWIGEVKKNKIVRIHEGFTAKTIDKALKDYKSEYPTANFIKCKCIFQAYE